MKNKEGNPEYRDFFQLGIGKSRKTLGKGGKKDFYVKMSEGVEYFQRRTSIDTRTRAQAG